MAGPLDGYKVVELSEGIAGPYAAMELGDGGADVIKVERPEGDRTRGWGSKAKGSVGAIFRTINRNKRAVTTDIDSDAGAALVRRLVEGADIVITDAGWSKHPDLQPEGLLQRNPNLIVVRFSLYGDQGPWANQPPYGELAAQMASETTTNLGVISEAPLRIADEVGQMFCAVNAVQAACAALYARENAGGQIIDMSLLGSLVVIRSTMWVALSNPDFWWGFHVDAYTKPPQYGYRCKDGYVQLQLQRMSRESRDQLYKDLNMEWVRDDPQFALLDEDTGGGTGRNSHVVQHLWDRALSNFTREQVYAIAEKNGANAFPKNTYEMFVNSPQSQSQELITTVQMPAVGSVEMMRPPWDFGDTLASIRRPAPGLGEHTAEVLAEVGVPAR